MSPKYSIERACSVGKYHVFDTPDETGEYPTGLQDPSYPSIIRQNLDNIGEFVIDATLVYPDERTASVEVFLKPEGWGASEVFSSPKGGVYMLRVATHRPLSEITAARNRERRRQTRVR